MATCKHVWGAGLVEAESGETEICSLFMLVIEEGNGGNLDDTDSLACSRSSKNMHDNNDDAIMRMMRGTARKVSPKM